VWYLICSYVGMGGGEVVFARLVSLASSPELFVLAAGLVCLQGFAMCACA